MKELQRVSKGQKVAAERCFIRHVELRKLGISTETVLMGSFFFLDKLKVFPGYNSLGLSLILWIFVFYQAKR